MNSKAIKENKDFRRLYHRGKSFAAPVLVTYVMKSRGPVCRIGITSSKKIGNAVQRNRARRVIRAAFSQLEPSIIGKWDIVFVARTRTTSCAMQDVLVSMREQLKKAGVIK